MLHHDVSYSFTSLSFFFYRRFDVEAYSMVTNSFRKVFGQKSTDEEELQSDLKEPNPKFFKEKYKKFR